MKWKQTWRLVPSRYPPVELFERIADPADWELLAALEGLTNDRLRDQAGDIALVPVEERVAGPGASPIMAAFTHIGFPSRFTDGTYGVYYASNSQKGALAEIVWHHTRFMQSTDEPPLRVEMRAYVCPLTSGLHDIRGGWPAIHRSDDYGSSQKFGRDLRESGSNGIVYDSVRLAAAHNVAVFRPRVLASREGSPLVVQGPHFILNWDGSRFDRYIEVGEPGWVSL